MPDIEHWKTDHGEPFPHLANAPIVEAVIHWKAEPSETFDFEVYSDFLKKNFRNYELKHQHRMNAEITDIAVKAESCLSGFRLTSRDKKHVCQFLHKDIIFSRLKPYDDWKQLLKEATAFWLAYQELVKPISIEALGVRFISRIELHKGEHISEVVNEADSPLDSMKLSLETFFRRDEFRIPDSPYTINFVRAIEKQDGSNRCLIVDIDAQAKDNIKIEKEKIDTILEDLHYLKNRVFFEYLLEPETRFGDN